MIEDFNPENEKYVGDFNGDGKSDLAYARNYQTGNKGEISILYLQTPTWGSEDETRSRVTQPYEVSQFTPNSHIVVNDFNGDGKSEFCIITPVVYPGDKQSITYYTFKDMGNSLLVKKIVNGMGGTSSFTYAPISNPLVYTCGSSACTFPVSRYTPRDRVIQSYKHESANSIESYDFTYRTGRLHRQGKGFLGFETLAKTDANGITTQTSYGYHLSYFNAFITAEERLRGTTKIAETLYTNDVKTWGYGKRIFPFVREQKETDLLTSLSKVTKIDPLYIDDYTNIGRISVEQGNVSSTDDFSYNNPRLPNLLTYKTNTKRVGGELISRGTRFSYDSTFEWRLVKVEEDVNSDMQLSTTYSDFGAFNQPGRVVVSDKNGNSRTETISYTSSGRFVASKTDLLGQTTAYTWDETRGVLLSLTDDRGTTKYTYGPFDRLEKTEYPDGRIKADALQWVAGVGNGYYTYTETSGSSPVWVYYDALGREVERRSYGLNNARIAVQTRYDVLGRKTMVSAPYPGEYPTAWDETISYDAYGRTAAVMTLMDTSRYEYNALATTVKSAEGTRTIIRNTAGQVGSVTTNGKTVTHSYNADGLVASSGSQEGGTLWIYYDRRGNRTKLNDPDAGLIVSSYNAFGDILSHQQGENTSTYTYDAKGRLSKKKCNQEETLYSYDDQVGRPARIKCISGSDHGQSFEYDGYDRPTKVIELIAGRTFVRFTEYDAFGRVKLTKAPSGYISRNLYDDKGIRWAIRGGDHEEVFTAIEANARGQVTKRSWWGKITTVGYNAAGWPASVAFENIIGEGYSFDNAANLTRKTDFSTGQSERYSYDELHRLVGWSLWRENNLVKKNALTYDTKGNIVAKSDLDSLAMCYGQGTGHALRNIEGVPTRFPAQQLVVTYTPFNKIKSLSEGNKHYQITYGVDDERRKSVYKVGNKIIETRYYLGDYELVIDSLGREQQIHTLENSMLVIDHAGWSKHLYAYTDYQGSLLALFDTDGNLVERYSYDPWGNARNPYLLQELCQRQQANINRGYTGHEHIVGFDIINMNGRIYDPLSSQFFSPDPQLQDPDNWLNYNRYAYCYGNPLKYTDPSGEETRNGVEGKTLHSTFPSEDIYTLMKRDKKQLNSFCEYLNQQISLYNNAINENQKVNTPLRYEEEKEILSQQELSIISNVNNGVSFVAGGAQSAVSRAIKREMRYYVRGVSTISPYRVMFKLPVGNIFLPLRLTQGIASGLKHGGRALGILGAIQTIHEMEHEQKGRVEGGLDLIMGGVGFIPKAGWAVSGVYFIGKSILEYTNNDFWK